MYKIELGISTAMSLHALSTAGSEENEELEEDEEITEDDIADVILSTSDEDFEKLSPEDFEKALTGDNEDALGDGNEDEPKGQSNQEEQSASAEEGGSEEENLEGESGGDQPNEEEQTNTVDEKQMKEAYDLLFGNPIKASGREVQIRNPQHAKNFIEMGIDYNKKMQSMRPHLTTLKTLEKEGLLDDMDKLNLLLEVKNGNQDALKRLIAESEIDPLDLADEDVIEAGRGYKPQNHLMSEKEVEIGEALDSIADTPTQERTIAVMTKEFDSKSREIISDNPRYIVALNDDIASGVYDEVMDAVQYKKDMRLVSPGMSDIEMYIETVNEIKAIDEGQAQNQPQQNNQMKKQSSAASKDRKRQMSSSRSSAKPKKREYDPMEVLGMSDEQYLKEMGNVMQL